MILENQDVNHVGFTQCCGSGSTSFLRILIWNITHGNGPLSGLLPWTIYTSLSQGSIFRSENDIYSPPPSENYIFPPLATRRFSTTIVAFYPFTSPFLIFFPLFSFFFPLSSFFFYFFPLFLFAFSYFFPQMTSADIFSSPRGGGVFSNI